MTEAITTLEGLLARLAAAPEAELVFAHGGAAIRPGYHVTELKSALVESIDCGRGRDAWRETVVQLLDGAGEEGERMTAAKFAQIARASIEALPALRDGALGFEFAPENGAMRRLSALAVEPDGERIVVSLGGVAAACKPAVRMRAETGSGASGCCGPAAGASGCGC